MRSTSCWPPSISKSIYSQRTRPLTLDCESAGLSSLVAVARPLSVWVASFWECIPFMQTNFSWVVEVSAIRVFTDFHVLAVVRNFPTGFKLVFLPHAITPSSSMGELSDHHPQRRDPICSLYQMKRARQHMQPRPWCVRPAWALSIR